MSEWKVVPGREKVKVSDSIGCMKTYSSGNNYTPKESLYERTKREVYATGNKWAIENFHATHD